MKILSRSSVSFRIPHFALLISFCILHSALCIALAEPSPSDRGDRFTDEEAISLNLGGKTREVEFWSQNKWNGQVLAITNGTLTFTKGVNVHGGQIYVAPDATLRFARGAHLGTGLGDAGTRVFNVAPGGRLDMDGVEWDMDHTRVILPKGAAWNADLARFTLQGSQKNNLWDIGGAALFPRTFPDATKEGREAYTTLVKKLAGEVKQSATISSETEGETDAICFSVYQNKAYFLNMDTRRARTFDYILDGKSGTITLKPCEIRTLPR